MAEAQQGRYVVQDMLAPVVKAVLYFMHTGEGQGDGSRLIKHLTEGTLVSLLHHYVIHVYCIL